MKRQHLSTVALTVTVASIFSMPLRADDAKPAEAPAAELKNVELDADAIAKLIEQLDDAKFAVRQQASRELEQAGESAIPALAKAAQEGGREAMTRALEVLKKHFNGGDAAMKAAAEKALKEIAANEKSNAARRADKILNPDPEPAPVPQFPGIQIAPGGIQIQLRAVAGNGKKIQTKIVNGVKEVVAEENGRKVKIVDDPNNGIKIEVTEKKDGKEQTQKYEAKDADDLKKKHPEAHKIYKEYSQGGAGIQIQGIQIQGGNVPFQLPIQQIQPKLRGIESRPEIAKRLDKVKGRIEEATKRLEKLAESADNAAEIKKAIEELQKSQEELQEARGKLFP